MVEEEIITMFESWGFPLLLHYQFSGICSLYKGGQRLISIGRCKIKYYIQTALHCTTITLLWPPSLSGLNTLTCSCEVIHKIESFKHGLYIIQITTIKAQSLYTHHNARPHIYVRRNSL